MKIKYKCPFEDYSEYFKTIHLIGNWYLMQIPYFKIVNKKQFPDRVDKDGNIYVRIPKELNLKGPPIYEKRTFGGPGSMTKRQGEIWR